MDLNELEERISKTFRSFNDELNSIQDQMREQREINIKNKSHLTSIKNGLEQTLERIESNDKEFAKTKWQYEMEISMLKGNVEELKKTLPQCNQEVLSLKELNSFSDETPIVLDGTIYNFEEEYDSFEKDLDSTWESVLSIINMLKYSNDKQSEYRDQILNKDEVIAKLKLTVDCLTAENKKIMEGKYKQ